MLVYIHINKMNEWMDGGGGGGGGSFCLRLEHGNFQADLSVCGKVVWVNGTRVADPSPEGFPA